MKLQLWLLIIIFIVCMIQQFYDSPQVSTRINIKQIFDGPRSQVQTKTISEGFVAFSQERDKLGHLCPRNLYSTQPEMRKDASFRILGQKQVDPQVQESFQFRSDRTVERIFKINEIRGNKSLKDILKLKLVNPSIWRTIDVPALGNQKSAELVNKFKYKKTKPVQIVEQKKKFKKQRNTAPSKPLVGMNDVGEGKKYIKTIKAWSNQKVDYNLPELKIYHEMKKLKMKHYDNFQQDHFRFKQLVRHSQLLAHKLKSKLEFD